VRHPGAANKNALEAAAKRHFDCQTDYCRISAREFCARVAQLAADRIDRDTAIAGPIISFDCPPLPITLLSLGVMAEFVPVVEETVHRGCYLQWLLPYGRVLALFVSMNH
jgi:hypothetical protein